MVSSTSKTNWLYLLILVGFTGGCLYFIQVAFAKPFVSWQTVNEVHAAEIKSLIQ
ncbi:MAG: hypothetical protein WCW26_04270 [Candidatus Buchananbacteria bacterium]